MNRALLRLALALALGGPSLVPAVARAQAGIPYLVEPDRPAKTKAARTRAKRPPARDAGDRAAASAPEDSEAAPAGTAPADAAAATPPAPAVERTAGRPFSYFAELWARRRAALGRGDAREASDLLTELVESKVAAGWPDIFVYGDVLVREVDAALARGEPRTALSLAGAASLLSPHRPPVHYALARATWASSGGLWATMGSYWRGLVVAWTEPPLVRAHLGNALVAVAIALLAAAAALALTSLVRHSRLLVHDLLHLLPRGATRLQAALLGAALLLSPVFLRLGPLWVLTTWLVLLGLHYERRERAGAVLVLAAVAGLAGALPLVTSHLAYPGSRSEDLYLTVRDAAAVGPAERVRARQHLGAEEMYALGLRARWSGDIEEARAWLDRAATALTDDHLLVTAGNVRYLAGDRAGAIAAYQQALRIEHDSVPALFNLSRVYYTMMEHQKAGEAQRRAMSLDLERVERLNEEAKRATGTYLVDGGVPGALLGADLELGRAHAREVARIWSVLGAGGTRPVLVVVAAAAALALLLLGLLRRAVQPSALCPRCGMAACQRCNPEMPDQAQCGQCYHAFMEKEHVDPQACIRKEIQVHRYRARQTRVRQVLAVVLAGSGQLLRGAFLEGVLLMTGFLALLALVLWAAGVVPEPLWADGAPRGLAGTLAGTAMAALYVVALIDGLREDR